MSRIEAIITHQSGRNGELLVNKIALCIFANFCCFLCTIPSKFGM